MESRETPLNSILKPELNLRSTLTCFLKKTTDCTEYKSEDLPLSKGKNELYMNSQYVAGIEPSLLFG